MTKRMVLMLFAAALLSSAITLTAATLLMPRTAEAQGNALAGSVIVASTDGTARSVLTPDGLRVYDGAGRLRGSLTYSDDGETLLSLWANDPRGISGGIQMQVHPQDETSSIMIVGSDQRLKVLIDSTPNTGEVVVYDQNGLVATLP